MLKKILLVTLLLAAALFAYTKVMARIGSGEPPQMRAADQRADRITVEKAKRKMTLLRDGKVLNLSHIPGTRW